VEVRSFGGGVTYAVLSRCVTDSKIIIYTNKRFVYWCKIL
jgi:hypothetical protein